jgi:DNA-binding response OmpR family regulator
MTDGPLNTATDTLLIVDDIAPIRELYRDVAEDSGYAVLEAECPSSMSAALEGSTPTLILLDLTLPEADGLELLRDLARVEFSGPIILASGQDQEMIATAQRFGCMLGLDLPQTLTKPISVKTITTLLDDFRQETDSAQQQKAL